MTRTAFITTVLASVLGCTQSDSPPDAAVEPQKMIRSNKGMKASHPELEFFNDLSGTLEVELTVPTEEIGDLANVRATPEAKIKSLKLVAEVFNPDLETFRELTPDELQSIAFRASQITLRGAGGGTVTHQAPNGEFFTVQDMLNAVEETERQTRDKSEWFGGVDVHHVFFEGIDQGDDAVWDIHWGS